jgi:hypothetical protein
MPGTPGQLALEQVSPWSVRMFWPAISSGIKAI